MNWFGQTFRKVHVLYVSPQWAKERGEAFDAEVYAESGPATSFVRKWLRR